MKIIDQGKIKLNTSKSVAIERFSELSECSIENSSDNASISLTCKRSGEFSIGYYKHKHNTGKNEYVLSKLYGYIIEENGETYVSYYTTLSNSRTFWVCGSLVLAIILFLIFFFICFDLRALVAIVGCIIALIFQVSSLQEEKNKLYMLSKKYIRILEQKIDAVNNWEK